MRTATLLIPVFIALAFGACVDPDATFHDGAVEQCKAGQTKCNGEKYEYCENGQWKTKDCKALNESCVEGVGCRLCDPDAKFCKGQVGYQCNKDGTKSTKLIICREDQQCIQGKCFNMCDLPLSQRSNVGCVFWSVDLPNEYYCMSIDGGATCLTYGCAACQQFSVVIANTSRYKALITIEANEAKPGEKPKLKKVAQQYVEKESLRTFNLPMREVDCSTWKKDKAGRLRRKGSSYSCLSSTAYRIKSSYPVVAYQFNPIKNDFSNGASLLIPENGLDTKYLVMGWSTTNPIAIPMPGQAIEGVPDFTNVTIIGTRESTKVDVTLTHNIQGSPDKKVKATKKGQTISFNLGPFDVLNLNSIQDLGNITGDQTGTRIEANKPVAVFSGGQRASVPVSIKDYNPKPPEPSGKYDVCCTEHFEQQMFPISSLGKVFAITRTPIRSTSSPEPDFYRILATKDNTTVKTNLTNFPKFTLKKGQQANFWSVKDFTVESDQPIMIGQFAVAQGFLDNYSGAGGDPEFVVFPPVEQYRKDYIFLTPTTFTNDYVIIGAPSGALVELDGNKVSSEFGGICKTFTIGTIKTKTYKAIRCPVKDGVHRIKSSEPVGIMVYGYYSVGSYGYPGGADVKQINLK